MGQKKAGRPAADNRDLSAAHVRSFALSGCCRPNLDARVNKIEGRRFPPHLWGRARRGIAQPRIVVKHEALYSPDRRDPHPCLPPQGGKENASNMVDARRQGRARRRRVVEAVGLEVVEASRLDDTREQRRMSPTLLAKSCMSL